MNTWSSCHTSWERIQKGPGRVLEERGTSSYGARGEGLNASARSSGSRAALLAPLASGTRARALPAHVGQAAPAPRASGARGRQGGGTRGAASGERGSGARGRGAVTPRPAAGGRDRARPAARTSRGMSRPAPARPYQAQVARAMHHHGQVGALRRRHGSAAASHLSPAPRTASRRPLPPPPPPRGTARGDPCSEGRGGGASLRAGTRRREAAGGGGGTARLRPTRAPQGRPRARARETRRARARSRTAQSPLSQRATTRRPFPGPGRARLRLAQSPVGAAGPLSCPWPAHISRLLNVWKEFRYQAVCRAVCCARCPRATPRHATHLFWTFGLRSLPGAFSCPKGRVVLSSVASLFRRIIA